MRNNLAVRLNYETFILGKNKDIISDKTGYSTKAKNIDDIYKNLSLCIDELKSYNSNSRIHSGLQYAKDNFSLEKYNNNINNLYNSILK